MLNKPKAKKLNLDDFGKCGTAKGQSKMQVIRFLPYSRLAAIPLVKCIFHWYIYRND